MKSAVLAAVAASFSVALLTVLTVPACSDSAPDHACNGIPANGCPLSRGVACEDPACEAVYACRAANTWELDHKCPAYDAAASPDAAPDAPPVRDGAVDAPPGANGGPGCGSLQPPDCALGLALVCPAGCCDCEDLFVCQDGSWVAWGTCSLDGGIAERR